MGEAFVDDPYLRLSEVEREAGLKRSSIYRRIAAGTFPAPRDLGGGVVRWPASRIAAWKKGHADKDGAPPEAGGAGEGDGDPAFRAPEPPEVAEAAPRRRGRPRKAA